MIQGFQFASRLIRKRPLRMGLTLLQVGVGVAAITIVLSFVFNLLLPGGGGEDFSDVYWVNVSGTMNREGKLIKVSRSFFTDEILQRMKKESNYLDGVTICDSSYQNTIQYEKLRYRYRLGYWAGSDFAQIMNLNLVEGSYFTQADIDNRNPVVVISDVASKQLFGEESPIGKKIRHELPRQDAPFIELEVIGVYSELSVGYSSSENPHMLIPYSLRGEVEEFMQLLVRFKPGKLGQGQDELNMLFKHEFAQISTDERMNKDSFALEFRKHEQFGGNFRKEIAKSFGLFIGSFAFIALVVSSIGVLSMMLVSIVERSREIGLRRALGATRLSIIGQIVSESIMTSIMGGCLGIFLAWLGMKPIVENLIVKYLFQGMLEIQAHISVYAVLISLVAVVGVGLIAGLYPGYQASKMPPLEAVRDSK